MGDLDGADRITGLIEKNSSSLLAYFVRRVDEPADAADLLNDVLTVIWRRPKAMPADDEEARMWMFGVARRVLSTHRRSTRRRSDLVKRLRSELSSYMPPPQQDVEDIRLAIKQLADVDDARKLNSFDA